MKFKQLMQERGITRNDLAIALNRSPRTILTWENHQNVPVLSPWLMLELCRLLNIDLKLLVGLYSDEMPKHMTVLLADCISIEDSEYLEKSFEHICPNCLSSRDVKLLGQDSNYGSFYYCIKCRDEFLAPTTDILKENQDA